MKLIKKDIQAVCVLFLAILFLLWTSSTGLAQEIEMSTHKNSPALASSCEEKSTEERIELIAKAVVADKVSDEIEACYQSLSDKDKADVFIAMAEERGISTKELEDESREDAKDIDDNDRSRGRRWKQIIERIPFSALFQTIVSANSSTSGPYICDEDPDIDYIFRFRFSSAVTNPNALRTFTQSVGVDAMLLYYMYQHRGVNGFGNTSSRVVRICIGDTGVANAGGEQHVRDNLKLHR